MAANPFVAAQRTVTQSPKTKSTRMVLINFSDDFALGTRSIAAYVRQSGYDCDLIFLKRHNNLGEYHLGPRNYADLIRLLRSLDPAVIGLSVATAVLPYAEEASRQIRQAFPGRLVLWGGWHPTMNPERVLRENDVDAVGVGEAEATALEVLDRVERGEGLEGCLGLWTKRGATITPNPHRPLIQNLDDLPYFRYDEKPSYLIDDRGVHPFDVLPSWYGADRYGYAVVTSRGCPYNCSFCSVPFMKGIYGRDEGQFLRRRSVESVLQELEYARDVLGANYIWFFDEEFLFHRKWLRQFLPAYRRRIGLDWYCEAHPDSFPDEAFIDLLADSGLKDLEVGLQSASPNTLKVFNRPHRTQANLVTLSKRMAETGLRVTYDIILDNPLETEEDVRQTLEYLLRLHRPFSVLMFPLAFRENYPLTQTALARGVITEDDYETHVLEERRQRNARIPDPSARAKVGEFPFVSLSYLNCLIYLTQVDCFPRSWIRRMSQSPWWRRNSAHLARLVMFLHRTNLARTRHRLRRLLGLAWSQPGSFLASAFGRLVKRDRVGHGRRPARLPRRRVRLLG